MEPDIELKLKTEMGEVTACFVSSPISLMKNIYTGWIKEKPGVIVQADSIDEAIDELHISLKFMMEVETEIQIKEN